MLEYEIISINFIHPLCGRMKLLASILHAAAFGVTAAFGVASAFGA